MPPARIWESLHNFHCFAQARLADQVHGCKQDACGMQQTEAQQTQQQQKILGQMEQNSWTASSGKASVLSSLLSRPVNLLCVVMNCQYNNT